MDLQRDEAHVCLAVSDRKSPDINIFDISSGEDKPINSFKIHASPVVAMAYNPKLDIVISADEKGSFPTRFKSHQPLVCCLQGSSLSVLFESLSSVCPGEDLAYLTEFDCRAY